MRTNLDDLYLFTVLVEQGSFTRAATQLNIAKSKLSRRLSQLEKSIGSQLLSRTTRKQQLTQSGQLLYQACKGHIDALSKVEEDISSFINQPQGQLNLLLPLEFFNQTVSELIMEFASQYPKINLSCSHYSTPMPPIDNRYDLTFVLHETQLPNHDWIAKTLISFPQSLFAAATFDSSHLTNISDLSQQDCVLASPQEQWLFRANNHTQVIDITGRIVFSSPEMRLAAVEKGLGIAKLPDYSCHQQPHLQRIVLDKPPVAQQLSVLFQSRSLPIKTRAFLDFFQTHIGRFS